jgi:methionyl-tRNA synthetase
MLDMGKYFIATSIPYVNGEPHIGHSLEFVQADVLARFWRVLYGKENVVFLSGTDENALKNVIAAEEAGQTTQEFVAAKSKSFAEMAKTLNVSYDDFIRTTEERHVRGAQKLWMALDPSDIYKDSYEGLYCVGCEEFKTEEDLVEGVCPEHKKVPEKVSEQNYFFRLSKYQSQIEELISKDIVKIVPEKRKNEVLGFLKAGLRDFSISRSVSRARGWGIDVPNDPSQKIYVWIDALSNYITALGYATNESRYQDFWVTATNKLHVIGKGIVKFHALYWIGMLLSAKLPLPTEEFVHGYVTVDGNKIGKSLGNAIHPGEVVAKYGVDAFRYFLLREIPAYGDGDFSWARMQQIYVSDLQNGIGNLTSRIATMAQGMVVSSEAKEISPKISHKLKEYRFDEAINDIWARVAWCNERISEKEVWKLDGEEKSRELILLVSIMQQIAVDLACFLPDTAKEIAQAFEGKIVKIAPLFPRL